MRDRATGAVTDGAFAGLQPKGGVLESFGLRDFGAHSNDEEYIVIPSIAPRLVLSHPHGDGHWQRGAEVVSLRLR